MSAAEPPVIKLDDRRFVKSAQLTYDEDGQLILNFEPTEELLDMIDEGLVTDFSIEAKEEKPNNA